jgi:type II secretory pathway component GspD/PulD (secretin)
MRINLEDYFKDLDAEDSNSDQFFQWYFGFDEQQDKEKDPKGLGKGNKLRFVDDPDTNTLVVNGATAEQLRTIAELIELWDVPEPVNKRKTRFTRLVEVKFGTAEKIAETVKEAYRDLLSSNDKAFTAAGGGQQQPGGGGGGGNNNNAPKSRDGNGSGLENADRGQDGGGTDFSFKGKLSIGVDSVGNTLLVSAEGEPLLELVADMITQLDEAARPQGVVEVLKLSGSISSESLQNALRPVTGDTGAPAAAPPARKEVAAPEPAVAAPKPE